MRERAPDKFSEGCYMAGVTNEAWPTTAGKGYSAIEGIQNMALLGKFLLV